MVLYFYHTQTSFIFLVQTRIVRKWQALGLRHWILQSKSASWSYYQSKSCSFIYRRLWFILKINTIQRICLYPHFNQLENMILLCPNTFGHSCESSNNNSGVKGLYQVYCFFFSPFQLVQVQMHARDDAFLILILPIFFFFQISWGVFSYKNIGWARIMR